MVLTLWICLISTSCIREIEGAKNEAEERTIISPQYSLSRNTGLTVYKYRK